MHSLKLLMSDQVNYLNGFVNIII